MLRRAARESAQIGGCPARSTCEPMPDSALMVVVRRWANRGKNTDIEHLRRFFPGATFVSTEHAIKRPYRLLKAVAGWARQDGYTSYSLGMELAAIQQALRLRPRLIHFWYADHEYRHTWLAARLIGARIVGTLFFSIEEFERRMPSKEHLRRLDLVLASGRRQMDYLKSFVDEHKIAYLPLGVDTSFFCPPADPARRWAGGLRLLQVGVNRRDFSTLRMVFLRLKDKYPDLTLEMVGCRGAQDGFEGQPGITFHPFLNDEQLLDVYHRATLLILPLLEGGSSQALNEALATGLPVVTNQMPNLEDYASTEGVAMCPPGDADAMFRACDALLSSRERWEQASQHARRHMQQFDWGVIHERLLALYEQYLGLRVVTL